MGAILPLDLFMVRRSCKSQAISYKLQATSYKLQATSYKLQVTSYKLREGRGREDVVDEAEGVDDERRVVEQLTGRVGGVMLLVDFGREEAVAVL